LAPKILAFNVGLELGQIVALSQSRAAKPPSPMAR
jgi:hypothetical protein